MDSINSVAKGIFVFKNGPSIKKLKKIKSNHGKSLVNKGNEEQTWYNEFQKLWSEVEEKIEKIQSKSYERILANLLSFIRNIEFESKNLQTAVLLTGVNQIDHLKQFETLSLQIENNCSSIVTILQSRDCPNLKSTIEMLVAGFINQDDVVEVEDEDDNNDNPIPKKKLKKSLLTFSRLESWYHHMYGSSKRKPSLVLIIADFEQFNTTCIQDLIGILSLHISRLPLVLIVGVATAFKTLHNVLPAHVTKNLDTTVFRSETSTAMLNMILDEVILTHRSPFQLSGKSFQILLDIFLFYDYSLHSFIKGYKVFMLEHFSARPLSTLFANKKFKNFDKLTADECDSIRRSCLSFRKYVDAVDCANTRYKLIKDDDYLKSKLSKRFSSVKRYLFQFHCCLRILVVLFEDLPKNDLGKLVRQLYPICMSSDVTKLAEYKECFNLLRFTSKDKFIQKIEMIQRNVQNYLLDEKVDVSLKTSFQTVYETLATHRNNIFEAGMSPMKESTQSVAKPKTPSTEMNKKGTMGRQQMMDSLKENAKNNPSRVLIEYERRLCDCLDYINSLMENYLKPAQDSPVFHEFFVFSDCQSVRRQIVGAPRGALHNALFNPQHYLQCSCCNVSENEQILASLPDTAIAYKLHLESSKFINLYDWLQAFAMVIETNEDEDEISPEVQARFTRSIGELQFLGFIKNAKNKTDHVVRLTF